MPPSTRAVLNITTHLVAITAEGKAVRLATAATTKVRAIAVTVAVGSVGAISPLLFFFFFFFRLLFVQAKNAPPLLEPFLTQTIDRRGIRWVGFLYAPRARI